MENHYEMVIIGGGLAGLAAAVELEKFNLKTLVIDDSDRVGGRVKTDEVEDFLLDRGFQVYLSQYPEGQSVLDYHRLDFHAFSPGAVCFNQYEKFTVKDASRSKLAIPKMLFSQVGTFMDKVRLGNLTATLKATTNEEIFAKPEVTTAYYLEKRGFSKKIIERFFRPFFSGIFLENELKTSSRLFEFTFRMFALGHAALPAKGMEEIPKQLKAKLKKTEFRFHTKVESIQENSILLKNGEKISAKQIIVACDPGQIIQQLSQPAEWRETATYYFAAPKSAIGHNLIALNYQSGAVVNNFTVLTNTAPSYAPKNQHLVSVSLQETPHQSVEETCEAIQRELALAFGDTVWEWRFLKNYHLRHALPVLKNQKFAVSLAEIKLREGLYLAGDHQLNTSIDGALRSGRLAAQAAILDYKNA